MRTCRRASLVAAALLMFAGESALAQVDSAKETWPAIRATFDLKPRLGVLVYAEKHNGEDGSLAQWKLGTTLNFRMRRILKRHRDDIDEENEYNLVVGGGYEFIKTNQINSTKVEHRVILQSTPKYMLPARFLVQDRSRIEFRWNAGTYNFRYRNKLTVDRPFKINKFRFQPYASGELFWDRNHHAWNENQYAFGVQFPYKKLLMLDTYFLRQNCTTCSHDPVGVFGIRLNLYFRRRNP
jgi:hypothetical protein